ncbi:hypothetical protein SKUN_00634 [Spiroplasma kunkelii CR2-3x]|uniref:Uncharacterized protein n=1 Tax=Spiroplasma kunkelii CR2-3x TaxID=273035 RepID=A0A0K2JGH8_SPIKU|nr:hypothetical protein [Spiroplasma kunkelii]ALA97527.1 hypothetical protein SKUN_00634 [Spiroplasma kunkelii CR2-3x]
MNNARYLLIQKTYLGKLYRINSFLFYTATEAQSFSESNKDRDNQFRLIDLEDEVFGK